MAVGPSLDSVSWGCLWESEQTGPGEWRVRLGTFIHSLIHSFNRSLLSAIARHSSQPWGLSAVNKPENTPYLIVVCILKEEDKNNKLCIAIVLKRFGFGTRLYSQKWLRVSKTFAYAL